IVSANSVPVGVVTLAERKPDAPFAEMFSEIRERFAAVRRSMDCIGAFDVHNSHLLGTSGTVTTLAGIALGLERYNRARVDASWHKSGDILAVVDRLAGLDLLARREIGCIGPQRAELVIPGCAIFAAIHSLWPCAELRVADRGLREGLLRDLLAETRR